MATRNILFEASPYDPATDNIITVRMAHVSADDSGVVLDGYEWRPIITETPNTQISQSWFNDPNGEIRPLTVNHGDIGFLLAPEHDNQDWSTYSWEGALGRIWVGNLGDGFSSYKQVFEGSLGPLVERDGQQARIALLGREEVLRTPFLTSTYAGTGAAEGRAELTGVYKPWASGRCRNITAVLVDPVYWVYQYHGYGPTDDVEMVYQNALEINSASAGTAATYAALIAMDLEPGEWAKAPAVGMFRLGGEPNGKVTATVRGAKDGTSYVSTIATIAPHLMKQSGLNAAYIDQTSLAAFTQGWCFYTTSQADILSVVQSAFQHAGGYIFPSSTGVFKAGSVFASDTPVALTPDRSTLPLVNSVKQGNAMPPAWKVRVGAERCWTVHSSNEVSPAIQTIAADAAAANQAAADAAEAANLAHDDALSALSQLSDIVSDGKLDRSEKANVIREFQQLTQEKAGINSKAVAAGAASENTAYNTAYNALNSYLNGLSPAYTDTSQVTTIVRSTWDTKWKDLYLARQNVLNRIAELAAQTANWSGVAGRPLSLADLDEVAAGILDDAVAAIDRATDDGILTRNEKFTKLIPAHKELVGRYHSLITSAASVGLKATTNNQMSVSDILSQWVKLGTNLVTVADNVAPNPIDGRMTADRVSGLQLETGERLYRYLNDSRYSVGDILTASTWVKGEGTDIGKTVQLRFRNTGGGGITSDEIKIVTLTKDWQEVRFRPNVVKPLETGWAVTIRVDQTTADSMLVACTTVVESDKYLPWIEVTGPTSQTGATIVDAAVSAYNDYLAALDNCIPAWDDVSVDSQLIAADNLLATPLDLTQWHIGSASVTPRPDGYFDVADTETTQYGVIYRPITDPAIDATYTAIWRVKKDNIPRSTRAPMLYNYAYGDAGVSTAQATGIRLDTKTGEFITQSGSQQPGTYGVIDGGDEWIVWVENTTQSALNHQYIRTYLYATYCQGASFTPEVTLTGNPVAVRKPQMLLGRFADLARASLDTRTAAFARALDDLASAIRQVKVEVQWAPSSSGPWDATYSAGTDYWMRQSNDGGVTWGAAIKAIGEDGADGATGATGPVGAKGNYRQTVFKKALSAPPTPSGNGPVPSGWSDAPVTTGTGHDYMSTAELTASHALVGSWSTPIQVVQPGAGSFTIVHANANTFARAPNLIRKVGGGGNWTSAAAYSQESFTNGAYVSWRAPASGSYSYMVGLSVNPDTDPINYTRMYFHMYMSSGAVTDCRVQNSVKVSNIPRSDNDRFAIHYDGQKVRFYKNDVLLHEEDVPSNLKLHLDFVPFTEDAEAHDLAFGPAGSAGKDADFTSIYETFSDSIERVLDRWMISNPANVALVTSTDTGGKCLRIGGVEAGQTNDYVTLIYSRWMPYSPEDLYEVAFDVDPIDADPDARIYLGVAAVDNAGNNLGNSYNYVAASSLLLSSNLARTTYRGFMRGYAAISGGSVSNSMDNPTPLPTGAVSIRPIALVHYPSGAGRDARTNIHSVSLRKVSDATIIWTGTWSSSRAYFQNEGVTYQGRAFASKNGGNLNHAPPTIATSNSYWYLVADKGTDGTDGSDGVDGDDGAGTYTLIHHYSNTSSPTPNSVLRNSTAGWNGGVYTRESYVNGAYMSFRVAALATLMCGLVSVPTSDSGYSDIDYAMYCQSDGVLRVYESGVHQGSIGTYTANDTLAVHYDGKNVRYYKNGVVLKTTAAAANKRFYMDCAINTANAQVNELVFTAAGSAGIDGDWRDFKFMRSLAQPATPAGNNPSGWSDEIPEGDETIWMTVATKTYGGDLIGGWATPQAISGETWRGAWTAGETYYPLNKVTYGGGTYLYSYPSATTASTSNRPTGTAQSNTYWDVAAAPGAVIDNGVPDYTATINIGARTGPVNLRDIADNHTTPYPGGNATITFNVTGNITGAQGSNAITTGTWPTGKTVNLTLVINSGVIVRGGGGRGGNGGTGTMTGGTNPGGVGGKGGDAINVQHNITIDNNGTVQGGGGGGRGGAGGREFIAGDNSYQPVGGSGGGGGAPNGGGGTGGFGAFNGSAGTTSGGGAGGVGGYANGSAGGTYATAGGGSGGAAGYAVRHNGKTVTYSGTTGYTGARS